LLRKGVGYEAGGAGGVGLSVIGASWSEGVVRVGACGNTGAAGARGTIIGRIVA
jgi:hypothetical protein